MSTNQDIYLDISEHFNVYDEKSGIFKRSRVTDAYKFRDQSRNLQINAN